MSDLEDRARALLADASRAEEEYLSVKEYAALFHVTANAVYTAVRRKTLPYPVDRPLNPKGQIQIRVPVVVIHARRCA